MQWLIDIIKAGVLAELPNLVSLNAISPAQCVFPHGAGDAWESVSGSTARDALDLGASDSVTFADLTLADLTLDGTSIQSATGELYFNSATFNDVADILCANIFAHDIDCDDLACAEIDMTGSLEGSLSSSQLHLGFAGSGHDIELRRPTGANLSIRKNATFQIWQGFNPSGGFITLWDSAGALQALISGYQSGNTQAYFKLGRVGIGTSAPAKMLDVNGDISLEAGAGDYYSNDGSQGYTGTFTEHTGKTVTCKNGLVTAVA